MNFFIYNERFCPRILILSQRYRNYLTDNGWKASLQPKADLILVFGCDFSLEEQEYALSIIRKFRASAKESAKIVLTGCLPSVRKDLSVPEPGTYVFGLEEASRLDGIIGAEIPFNQTAIPNVLSRDLYEYTTYRSRLDAMKYFVSLAREGRFHILTDHWTLGRVLYRAVSFRPDEYTKKYYLLLSTGCLSECSYCSERYVFRTHQSRPEDQIVQEFRKGIEMGFDRFTLEAYDTGTYGFDIRTDVLSLLSRLHACAGGNSRIEVLNLNPRYLIEYFPRLLELFKLGKISMVQVPVQSGSNRVLELMNRKYDIGLFRECIRSINEEVPQLKLDTHFIVGHPGEREQDFQQSLDLIRELKFHKITAFAYEPKENTLSATMPEQVPEEEKSRRFKQVWTTALKSHLARWQTDLFEKLHKKEGVTNAAHV